jgi:hypothetical protein
MGNDKEKVDCVNLPKCHNKETMWCKLCECNLKNDKNHIKGFFFNTEEKLKNGGY